MKKVGFLFMLLFALGGACFPAQFDFADRDFSEILYAVSLFKGFPVIGDDTVYGSGDFRCAGEDFDAEFDSFLNRNRLYCKKTDESWIVSRVKIEANDEATCFSLDARDVSAAVIYEKLELACGICIISDVLPSNPVSVHTGFCSTEEIIKRVTALCDGYEMNIEKSGFFRIVRGVSQKSIDKTRVGKCDFRRNEDGSWSVDTANAGILNAVEKFCAFNEREFCFVSGENARILRSRFKAQSVEEVLSLLCQQCGCDLTIKDGIFIVSEAKGNEAKGRSFGKSWWSSNLKYQKGQEILSLLNRRFPAVECICLSDNSIEYLCDESTASEIQNFITSIDSIKKNYVVQLQYIQVSDFLSNLPPFVEKDQVRPGSGVDKFYFTGTKEAYENLLQHLQDYDKPATTIRYDLLIMQYQKTDGSNWTPSLRASRLSLGDLNEATVQLGSVLDFSLDVVGAFGMKFAAQLEAAISESRAKVFADTTLTGVSGSTIHFENTNTYRYRDNNLDPDTGKPVYSGVTKEISSGLKLEVTGVVTGDGMVTSKITASVSRQGTDLSSTTGNPPPTSEKMVTTEVRSKSGEPVILSGLVQEEENNSFSRLPFISRLPLIRHLFRASEKSKEQTEVVIYLVPSAEVGDGFPEISDSPGDGEKSDKDGVSNQEKAEMVRLYREFVYEK